jgi:hypothetical protein
MIVQERMTNPNLLNKVKILVMECSSGFSVQNDKEWAYKK